MEEKEDTLYRSDSIIESNETKHYTQLTIAIIIGFAGVMIRFITHGFLIDLIANTVWIIGIIIALFAVSKILQEKM